MFGVLAVAFAAALALVPAPAAIVIDAPCPAVTDQITSGACAYNDGRIYLPRGSTRFMREHENGHVFIAQRLSVGERRKAQRLIEMPDSRAWRTVDPFESPDERVADIYAACRLRLDPRHHWEASYDYYPSRHRFRRQCAFLARAADCDAEPTVTGPRGTLACTSRYP